MNPSENAIESAAGLSFLLQLLLLFYFDNFGLNIIVFGIGWLMLIPSFLLLTLSLMTLRSYGNVPDGKSLLDTTAIVTKGVYGIIRHPLYAGYMLMSISLALISQSWFSGLCAVIVIPLVVIIIHREEKANSTKFLEQYTQYQKEVPLLNIFKGIWLYYRR
ncbi:MAG: methyltransferase family protein [Candidatus Thorarchaeota archaeon]